VAQVVEYLPSKSEERSSSSSVAKKKKERERKKQKSEKQWRPEGSGISHSKCYNITKNSMSSKSILQNQRI
jgi:hypothetical protein